GPSGKDVVRGEPRTVVAEFTMFHQGRRWLAGAARFCIDAIEGAAHYRLADTPRGAEKENPYGVGVRNRNVLSGYVDWIDAAICIHAEDWRTRNQEVLQMRIATGDVHTVKPCLHANRKVADGNLPSRIVDGDPIGRASIDFRSGSVA